MLPGRFVDRGGGAGLLLAARGGRSLSDGQSSSLSRSLAALRSGVALPGGDRALLGMGEMRDTSWGGAERGVGGRRFAAEAGVRRTADRPPRGGAAETGVRERGGAADTGVRERGGAADTGVRGRGGAAETGVRERGGAADRGVRRPPVTAEAGGRLNETDMADAPGVLSIAAVTLL